MCMELFSNHIDLLFNMRFCWAKNFIANRKKFHLKIVGDLFLYRKWIFIEIAGIEVGMLWVNEIWVNTKRTSLVFSILSSFPLTYYYLGLIRF